MHNFLYKSALIEPEDLQALLGKPGIKLLDASFVMPGAESSPQESFEKAHIPGAQFFDIEAVSDHTTDLPHMLPEADDFAKALSDLGISNDDAVIIYGQSGIVMGPARVWWTFRVFGHDNVRLLNGGLPAWKAAGLIIEEGRTPPLPRSTYTARTRDNLVVGLQDVQNTTALLVDARPAERFSGSVAEPRPGLRAGHIPGSVNVPCLQLVDPASGKLKPKAELEEIFKTAGVQPGAPLIMTCGSGVTACVLALALFELGYPDVPVYDGSWSEWGRADSGTAVATA